MTARYLLVAALFFTHVLSTVAQHTAPYKSTPSEVVTLASKILKEDRQIFIHVPKRDSSNLNKRFPVLYLMDGESHFDMLAQYADYLGRWDVEAIPPMIVVGIVNTKRTRDLTPTESITNYFGKPDTAAVSWMKPSGGNKAFLQFIRDELMPYVNTHYKTQPFSIFAGHSFGGLASVHCLLTQPNLFDAYIAVSPSFWWDNDYVLKLADKTLKPGTTLTKTIFYSDASEGVADNSTYHTNLLKFDALLTEHAPKGLSHQYKYYPAETHMTSPVVAYFDGLRFIFKDWKSR
ncbi:alpha/beta hydrolase [Chryseolinea lacunae]|uniref:Alpha/beta hydrolase n=1 Tax=Chryseolinea lacunae TaxID=2801331 RepID=A0ABS1KU16_9BACT|nr:alpha/beta hydrolase-fold protein [Chryseolinea lacunae]MBL0742968.1 alpha/beta hydrolase [Chryseolinea lacunae]